LSEYERGFEAGIEFMAKQRDPILARLVNEHPEWNAHLRHKDDDSDWPYILCLHDAPLEKKNYHIAEHRRVLFENLGFIEHPWDGHP
jgi:hypothetical protein